MSTVAVISLIVLGWLLLGSVVGLVLGRVLKHISRDYPEARAPRKQPQNWPPHNGHR